MKVINYKEVKDAGALIATFTVFLPDWGKQNTDGKYFKTNKGHSFVTFASTDYVNSEGVRKYYSLTRWPKETTESLSKAVIKKIESNDVELWKPFQKEEKPAQKDMWSIDNDQTPF